MSKFLRSPTVSLSHGTLVMYENDGAPLLAVVCGLRKDKYHLLNERGREIDLAANRLHAFKATGPGSTATTAERLAYVKSAREKGDAVAAKVSVPEVWEFVSDEPKEYRDDELAVAYFADDDVYSVLGMRLALIGDKVYFRREKAGFLPRGAAHVEELRKADEAKARKREAFERGVAALRAKAIDPAAPLPDEAAPLVELLADYAVFGSVLDGPRQKEAAEALASLASGYPRPLTGHGDEKAYRVLRDTGYFTPETNLALLRHRPPTGWSAEESAAAEELPVPPEEGPWPGREDFTRVRSVTVDDDTTRDMDDALSVEQIGEGYRIGVHVSDVAWAVPEGSVLDATARRRATSIYCLSSTVHMLPEAASVDRLSLVEGRVRYCVSCVIEVDRHFGIVSTRMAPTVIRVSERLDYDRADESVESGDHDLGVLYNVASVSEAARIKAGGYRVQKREAVAYPDGSGGTKLVEVDETSPARSLVSELMVLYNHTAARLAAEHGFALPFRTQERPDDAPLPDVPPGPAHEFAVRTRLKRSVVSVAPGPHATLGLDAYAQLSSPIRRYLDLHAQRQLKHFLEHGAPLYPPEKVSGEVAAVEDPLAVAMVVSRESKRYWILRYLEERAKERPTIRGTVVKADARATLAELEEVYLTVPVKVPPGTTPGTEIDFSIVRVDARADALRLDPAR